MPFKLPLPFSTTNQLRATPILVVLVIGLAYLTAACSSPPTSEIPTSTPQSEPTQTATQTAPATQTPTTAVGTIYLVTGPDADPAIAADLQPFLQELASTQGLRFQIREELSASELTAAPLVVVIAPYPDLPEIVSASPQTHFLAIGFPDIESGANLSVIKPNTVPADQIGFIAGFMAATISADWRVGVITEVDSDAGETISVGFMNGVFYMCGLCRPVYPPFPSAGYPLYVELPLEAGQADWESTANYLEVWDVQTVYIQPTVASKGLYGVLAEAGINIIGSTSAPQEFRDNWVASLRYADPIGAVHDLVPELLANPDGQGIQLPLLITDVNPNWLSLGRQQSVEEMMVDLFDGFIGTGVENTAIE